MSAVLSLSQKPIVSWKGKSFQQVASSIKKNTNTAEARSAASRAQPMKHYRRELILSDTPNTPNQRISMSVDNINAPGTTIVNSATCYGTDCVGGTTLNLHPKITEIRSERPCYPSSSETPNTGDKPSSDFSQAAIARRRVRSSGVISRKTRDGTTNDMYKTSNAQYLESRGLTFKQNQYNYVKEGSKTAIPGDVMSMNNIYVGNNMSNYPKLYISGAKSNNTFQYEWIDETTNTITFDDDYYDAAEFTAFIQKKMRANGHYYTSNSDGSILYLIEMYYDSYNQRFTLNCKVTSTTIHSDYSAASGSIPSTDTVPCVIIPSTNFTKVIGVSAGTYPSTLVENQSATYSSDQTVYGRGAQIRPAYKPIYYKPNNINYAQQGGVSSGDRISRLRYNTITTAGSTFRSAYGSQTASAYAYSVSATGTLNSLKQKMGFPNAQIPVINTFTDEICCTDKCKVRVGR